MNEPSYCVEQATNGITTPLTALISVPGFLQLITSNFKAFEDVVIFEQLSQIRVAQPPSQ